MKDSYAIGIVWLSILLGNRFTLSYFMKFSVNTGHIGRKYQSVRLHSLESSNLLNENENDRFKYLLSKLPKLLFCIPLNSGILCTSPQLVKAVDSTVMESRVVTESVATDNKFDEKCQ